jgi:hypothetical protein
MISYKILFVQIHTNSPKTKTGALFLRFGSPVFFLMINRSLS